MIPVSRYYGASSPILSGHPIENRRNAGVTAVRCGDFGAVSCSGHGQDFSWRRCVAAHFGQAQPCAHEEASDIQAKTPQKGLGGVLGPRRELSGDARDLGCGGAYARPLAKTLKFALLIGTVAACFIQIEKVDAIGVNEGIKEQGIASAHYSPTVSRQMFIGPRQCVGVSNPPPQVEELSTGLNIQQVLRGESWPRHVGRLATTAFHFWPEHARSRGYCWVNLVEIKICRHGDIGENAVSVKAHVPCGGIAAILPYRSDAPVKVVSCGVGFIQWRYAARENESSLVGNEGIPSKCSLSASGNPKCSGESGNDESCDRRDRRLVNLYEARAAPDVITDHDTESGWILFYGLILFASWVGCYALLESW
jgi:hypothetical protein